MQTRVSSQHSSLRFAVFILAVALMLAALSGAGAAADSHTHTSDYGSDLSGTWTAVSDLSSITDSGNYFLSGDIECSTAWTVPAGKDIHLCLNGNMIQYSGAADSVIHVSGSGTSLSLYDCDKTTSHTVEVIKGVGNMASLDTEEKSETYSGGLITGGRRGYQIASSSYYGGGVCVYNSGTFTMYGGTIAGNFVDNGGGGVCVSGTGSTFTLVSGEIRDNAAKICGGGVQAREGGKFEMRGGTITLNEQTGTSNYAKYQWGNGVFINGKNNKPASFTMSGGEITNNKADDLRVDEGGRVTLGTGATVTGNVHVNNGCSVALSGEVVITGDVTVGTTGNAKNQATTLTVNPSDDGKNPSIFGTLTVLETHSSSLTVSDGATLTVTDGVVDVKNGGTLSNTGSISGVVVNANTDTVTASGAVTLNPETAAKLPEDAAVTVESGASVTVVEDPNLPEGSSFAVENGGTLIVENPATFTTPVTTEAGATIKDSNEETPTYYYTITAGTPVGGSMTFTPSLAAAGTTVSVTITTADGYALDPNSVTITQTGDSTATPEPIAITETATGGTGTFQMPSSHVTVTATFTQTHGGVTFQPWNSVDSLPAGSGAWYLTQNVTLNELWMVSSGEVSLCLNGFYIRQGNTTIGVIQVSNSATLNIYDCNAEGLSHHFKEGTGNSAQWRMITDSGEYTSTDKIVEGGVITGGSGTTGVGGIYVHRGTLNIFNGSIVGNKVTGNGGGVRVSSSTFTMTGGAILGNYAGGSGGLHIDSASTCRITDAVISQNRAVYAGGIYVMDGTSVSLTDVVITENTADGYGGGVCVNGSGVTISGNTQITENKVSEAANNLYFKTDSAITISGTLADTASIGVTMETPGTFTNPTDSANKARFSADDGTYLIGTGEPTDAGVPLLLGKPQVFTLNIGPQTTIEDTDYTESSTIAAGSYIKLPTSLTNSTEGMLFAGWADQSGNRFTQNTMPDSALTLTDLWVEPSETYILTIPEIITLESDPAKSTLGWVNLTEKAPNKQYVVSVDSGNGWKVKSSTNELSYKMTAGGTHITGTVLTADTGTEGTKHETPVTFSLTQTPSATGTYTDLLTFTVSVSEKSVSNPTPENEPAEAAELAPLAEGYP